MDKKMEKWRIAVAFLMAAAMIGQSLWADGGTAFAAGYQEVMEPNSSKTVETVGQEAVEPKNGETVGTVGQEAVEPKNGKTVGTVGQEAVEPKNSKTVGTVGQEAMEPCGNGLAPEEQGFARSAARTASSMRAAKSTRTTALKLGKEEQENLEEGWSWKKDSDSPLSYTLTLDHVDFEVPGDSAISLYADSGFPIQNMNIALSGENRLISTNQTENAYNGCGIYLDSYGAQIKPAVLISGTGSLTVKGNSRGAVIQGSLSISGVSMDDQSEGSNGVVVSKSLNMENSALKSNYLSAEFLSMRNSSLSLFRAGASPQGKGLARIGSCDIEGSNLELSGAEGVDAPYAAISSNGKTVLIRNSSVAIRNVERGIEISTADSSSICLDHVTGTLFCSKTSQYLNKGNPAFYADQVEVSDSTLYVQTGDHIYAYGGCALPEEIKDVAVSGNLSIEEGKSFTVGKGQNMHFTANYATIEGGEGASFINNGTVEFSYSPNIKTSFVNNGRLDSGNGIDCSHQQFTNNGTFHGMVKEGSGTIHYYYGEAVHNFNRTLGESGRWISKAFLMPGAALIIPAGKYLDATKNGITWDNLDSYLSMGEGSRIIVEEGAELRLPPNDTGNKFPSLRVSGNGIVKIGDHALFRLECWDGETLLSTGFVKEDNTVTEPDAPIKEGCTFQGWYPEPEGGEPVDFSKPIDADTALYARWTVNMAIQEGDSVSAKGSITYGQPLSELEFYPTCFVEEGTGDKVAGVLSWKNPADIPKAGEFSAEWVFTPEDSVRYMGMEGTATVTVEKADPYISSLPAALQITYGDTLGSSALTGGKVQHKCPASAARANASTSANGIGQGGSPANIPAVSGGTAQLGSLDGVPMAFMDDSALPDSTAKPSSLDGDAVEGSFSWKDSDIKPTVADSNKTAYAIIFTPSDMENYNCVEAAVKLEVEPAEHAPNMPSKTMDVPNSCQKAGDIALPEGWQWLEPDTALLPGVSTKATAIYVGAGKGNYKEESAEITITRAICPHRTTKTINAKTATCVAEGYSGDILCTNCGATLETGKAIQPFGHSPNAIVVKQPTKAETGIREYRCTVCGILLQTEIIPKLTQAGATPEPPQEGTTPKLPESQGKVTKVQKEKNAYLLSAGLKATQSGRSITITWGRVKDADGYGLYIQYCGQKYSPKSCYTAKGGKNTKLTVQKINGKKLDLKKSYRIYVAAYKQSNGKKITLGKSITFHFAAKNSKKYTNAKAVKAAKTSFTLKKGKTAQIRPKTALRDKKKKLLSESHAKYYRYLSSNPDIATVSATGRIKAKSKGVCTICVFAQNGCKKKIKVYVK